MRELPIESVDPLWRQPISGARILFVSSVLVFGIGGLAPNVEGFSLQA